jgi:hypothetical protein
LATPTRRERPKEKTLAGTDLVWTSTGTWLQTYADRFGVLSPSIRPSRFGEPSIDMHHPVVQRLVAQKGWLLQTDGMKKADLRRDAVRSQVIDVLEAQRKRRPAMKKVSTVAGKQSRNISQAKLTIGLDLGDRNSWYCMVGEAGQIRLEQRVRTNAKGLEEIFGALPRCRIALETGTHSPWISRLLRGWDTK